MKIRSTWKLPLSLALAHGAIFLSSIAAEASQVGEPTEVRESFYFVTRDHRERFDPGRFFALFEKAEYRAATPNGDDRVLPYRLFKPRAADGARLPLIVWIHGYGDDEVDYPNLGQLKHLQLIFRDVEHPEKYPFFLLAPQNVESSDWFRGRPGEEKGSWLSHGELVLQLIDELLKRYPIDPARVTMIGISSGGTASWEFAARRPDRFAAIVPMGSGGGEASQLDRLSGVQVWAFHARDDHVPPDGDRWTVAALQSLGGCAQLTEIEGDEHNCWYVAFRDFDLLNWLLTRRKGSDCEFPARPLSAEVLRLGATYWPQLTILVAVLCGIAEVVRRRHRGRNGLQ